ncbi:redoxin domain-containing protein [Virgibacillus sp. DJP39]|uniref:redoxin domain-containing protein n=1 Tax=Virgibacillus sp. DJP39 TaxID=3409790 RepID=UPI003BB64A4B
MIKKAIATGILMLLVGLLIINVINTNGSSIQKETDVTNSANNGGTAIYSPVESGLEIGQQAPDFELETLAGDKVKLSDLRGKKVFLNFWATWCPPCKEEMPEMQNFYETHSDEVEILAVNVTGEETSVNVVRDFIDKYNYTYPILLDKKSNVFETYVKINVIPTTYFIGKNGIIQGKKVGPMTYNYMEDMLES